MDNLVSLNVAQLHAAEAGQFITRFFEDFEKSGLQASTDEDFKRLFTQLKAQLPPYAAALDQVQGSEETKNIVAADALRDQRLQSLRNALKAYRNADEEEAAAYHALNLLLKEYKGVEDSSYEEETLRLNKLTERMQSEEYNEHVQLLDLGKFVTKLSAANRDFNSYFANRSHQNTGKATFDLKKMKTALLQDYRTLAGYIAANAEVKASPFFKEVLKVLNNGRTYFADVVLARRKAKPTDGNTPK